MAGSVKNKIYYLYFKIVIHNIQSYLGINRPLFEQGSYVCPHTRAYFKIVYVHIPSYSCINKPLFEQGLYVYDIFTIPKYNVYQEFM